MNLKGYRKAIGKTQTDFAELLDISLTGYHMKENGQRKFTPDQMFTITNLIRETFPDVKMEDVFF